MTREDLKNYKYTQEWIKDRTEHIEEYKTNKNLREQFDAVLINDYTEKSKKELIDIIKKEILLRKETVKI